MEEMQWFSPDFRPRVKSQRRVCRRKETSVIRLPIHRMRALSLRRACLESIGSHLTGHPVRWQISLGALTGQNSIGRSVVTSYSAQSVQVCVAEIQAGAQICFCTPTRDQNLTFGRCLRAMWHKLTYPEYVSCACVWPSPVGSMPADNRSLATDNPAGAFSPGPIGQES